MSDLRADCPNRNHLQMHQRCELICPDLPKVLQGRRDCWCCADEYKFEWQDSFSFAEYRSGLARIRSAFASVSRR